MSFVPGNVETNWDQIIDRKHKLTDVEDQSLTRLLGSSICHTYIIFIQMWSITKHKSTFCPIIGNTTFTIIITCV